MSEPGEPPAGPRSADGAGWANVLPGGGEDAASVLRAVFGISPLPMVLTDPHAPDMPVVYCNPAFCRLTGYTAAETIGTNCRFLQGPETDPAAVRTLAEAIRSRGEVQVDIWNYRKDGSRFWNSMFVGPITDADGRLLYYFGSQIDASARQVAEEATNRERRMDSLGSMAAGLAHEINNLMTVVVGNVESLRKAVLEERLAKRLEHIEWAARATGKLTRQMLSFAGRHGLQARTVDLNDVVRGLELLLGQIASSRLCLSLEQGPTPLLVAVDLGQIELALINLVKNAVDASPTGNPITIATAASRDGGAASAEIAVVDEGAGMSAEVQARALDPFFTTKEPGKGTGLGLSMVAGFCQESGGRLAIESEPDKGTKVRMVFPLLAAGGGPPGAAQEGDGGPGAGVPPG